MHLSHLLDLIEVHNETALICMVLLDALSAEHCKMIRTVEMLHPLIMLITKQTVDTIFILKVYIS